MTLWEVDVHTSLTRRMLLCGKNWRTSVANDVPRQAQKGLCGQNDLTLWAKQGVSIGRMMWLDRPSIGYSLGKLPNFGMN